MASLYRRKLANGKYAKEWYLSWIDTQGGRHRDPLGRIDRPTAQAILTKKKLELIRNPTGVTPVETLNEFAFVDPEGKQPDGEYLRWYAVQYPSSVDRVRRIFKCHLLPEFGDLPLNLLARAIVVEWRNERSEEAASETVNKEIKTLKAALERATEWGKITSNPLSQRDTGAGRARRKDTLFLPKRKSAPPKFLTTEQLENLYRGSSERNAAMWKFLANTGLRRAELLNLLKADLFADKVIIVSTDKDPTKGRQFRTVPLNDAARAAANVLLAAAPVGEHLIRQMNLRSLSRCYKLDAARGKDSQGNPAPVPHSIHALRHTFCSHLVMNDVHLRTVQLLAGHADIQTTMIYAHLAPDFLTNSVSQISL